MPLNQLLFAVAQLLLLQRASSFTTSFIITPHSTSPSRPTHYPNQKPFKNLPPTPSAFQKNTALRAGKGRAKTYTWVEDRYDIDLSVKVPIQTKSSDVSFRSYPTAISLILSTDMGPYTLINKQRTTRGKVNMEGTFWSIADCDDMKHRLVTVHLEKIKPPVAELDVEKDWGGVFKDDDEEVIERDYDKEEELDVNEYAKSLGVDLDNLDMNLVDKNMFSGMMNTTKETLEDLEKKKFVRQVTQQGGKEYVDKGMDEGGQEEYSALGDGAFNEEELSSVTTAATETVADDIVTAEQDEDFAENSSSNEQDRGDDKDGNDEADAVDPIDLLTVARLKDILREQNLKVSGNKQQLRDRLRQHVQSLMNKTED